MKKRRIFKKENVLMPDNIIVQAPDLENQEWAFTLSVYVAAYAITLSHTSLPLLYPPTIVIV